VVNRKVVPPGLRDLAALQGYVLSREQVLGHGLSKNTLASLVESGHWRRVARGAYLTTPTVPNWEALAWAGILLGGDHARLGPEASGHLHGLLPVGPKPVDILVPYGRSIRVDGPWTFRRERPTARSPRTLGSPPRLTVEAALLDLTAARTESEVVGLVTKAVQLRRTNPKRISTLLAARSAHPHRTLLTNLLADVAEGVESPLELAYFREVERAHGLPRGNRQRSRRGLPYITDVGYDDYGLLVELDGRIGHDGEGRFRDMWRDNEFTIEQLSTLRYGWFDVVDRPCAVNGQVAQALQQRGWPGIPRRCRRCANLNDIP
jgi:hypothetical protein